MCQRHLKITNENQSRIIVVSDLHGGLNLLDELLEKVRYTNDDYLIILGDFLQRGYQNEATLDRMIKLSKEKKTYVLSGNHEHYLCSILEEQHLDRLDYHMNHIHYGCIIREWIRTSMLGYASLKDLQDKIKQLYEDDLSFLSSLPYTLAINDYLFVHGGIGETLENSNSWDLLSTPAFLYKTHTYKGTVVVGHWPVQNYKPSSLSGEVIIDPSKRIICIDGGYGVKSSGQLNALVIDDVYTTYSVDDLLPVQLKEDISSDNEVIVKLDYEDKTYKILERKPYFSLVEKMSSGEQFLMVNDYLEKDFEEYISYFISGKKGAIAGLIHECEHHTLIKLNGEIGWIKNDMIQKM